MENGRQYHSERLDRIEAIIEATASRQANIEEEFARLLKAQVVLYDVVNKFATILAEAGDKLNALISLTDQHLREHRERP